MNVKPIHHLDWNALAVVSSEQIVAASFRGLFSHQSVSRRHSQGGRTCRLGFVHSAVCLHVTMGERLQNQLVFGSRFGARFN